MINPDSFAKIDECDVKAGNTIIPSGVSRVEFFNSKGVPPRIDRLVEVLSAQRNVSNVLDVRIGPRSLMRSATVATAFPALSDLGLDCPKIVVIDAIRALPNLRTLGVDTRPSSRRSLAPLEGLDLEHLGVAATAADDVSSISRLKRLDSLTILKWPTADLSGLRRLALRQLAVKSQQVVEIGGAGFGRMGKLWAIGCTKLERFTPISAVELRVDACSRLELTSIANVARLIDLTIVGGRTLDSLEFLASCEHLVGLSTNCRVSSGDLSPILRHPSLKVAMLASVPDDIVLEASRRRPDIALSGRNVNLIDGKPVAGRDFTSLMGRTVRAAIADDSAR